MTKRKFEGQSILIYDLECSNEGYADVKNNEMRIFGAYSYITDKYYVVPYTERKFIEKLIKGHKFLVGFNNIGYDNPILQRMKYSLEYKRIIDLQKIIIERVGSISTEKGQWNKKLMKFSMDYITRFIGLVDDKTAKGDIDYLIFNNFPWSSEEIKKIKFYTKRDIELTKKLYEWLEDYFDSFKDFLPDSDIEGKYYLTDKIAKVVYKSGCHSLALEPTYNFNANFDNDVDKIGGGYVSFAAGEKFEGDILCLDLNSAYPHIFMQCNLTSRLNAPSTNAWHGNGVWAVEGYYDSEKFHRMSKLLRKWYYLRLFYKRKGMLSNGQSFKFKDISKYKGQMCDVVSQDVKDLELRNIEITDEVINQYEKLYNQGVDRREYTVKICINTCFSEDTEILTLNGIKLLKDCVIGEKVYSINKQTGQTEIKKITQTQKIEYRENMLHFYNSCGANLKVTPDHNMLVQHLDSKNIETKKAHEIFKKNFRYPDCKPITGIKNEFINMQTFSKKDCLWYIQLKNPYSQRKNKDIEYIRHLTLHYSPKGILNNLEGEWFVQGRKRDMKIKQFLNIKQLFYFIGTYLADGCKRVSTPKKYENGNFRGTTYIVNIAKHIDKRKDLYYKIKKCLDVLGFRYCAHKKGFDISSKFLYDFLDSFGSNAYDKKLPEWVFNYDHSILKYLHEGMYDCDGTVNQYVYSTAGLFLRDSFIKLLLHLGYKASYRKDSGVWRIIRRNFKTTNRISSNKVIKNDAKYVHCVTVEDNHTILAGRKGMFQWVGQCFGITDNPYYELFYDPIVSGDCTRIGRQWIKDLRKFYRDAGYKLLYTDSDSIYVMDHLHDEKKLLTIKDKYVKYIKTNVPFKLPTFDVGIDDRIKYMFFFKGKNKEDKDSDSEMDEDDFINKPLGLMKKNYVYVTTDGKIKVKNLGLEKKSLSAISKKIFWDYMAPFIKEGKIKFSRIELENVMREYLEKDISLALMRKSVKPIEAYEKSKTSMPAQISKLYGPGIHFMIPNLRDKGAGKGVKYCTYEEFKKCNMGISDIDFTNFWKELNYFIKIPKHVSLFDF